MSASIPRPLKCVLAAVLVLFRCDSPAYSQKEDYLSDGKSNNCVRRRTHQNALSS